MGRRMPCFNECYITIILGIMKHIKFITFFLSIACLFIACKNTADNDREGTSPTPEQTPGIGDDSFAKGADISWVTEMEAAGHRFYNAAGKQQNAPPDEGVRTGCGSSACVGRPGRARQLVQYTRCRSQGQEGEGFGNGRNDRFPL